MDVIGTVFSGPGTLSSKATLARGCQEAEGILTTRGLEARNGGIRSLGSRVGQ